MIQAITHDQQPNPSSGLINKVAIAPLDSKVPIVPNKLNEMPNDWVPDYSPPLVKAPLEFNYCFQNLTEEAYAAL